jgi:molybdate transport system permease protein
MINRSMIKSAHGSDSVGRAPVLLMAPALIGLVFLVLPLVGLLVRAPWADSWSILSSGEAWQALRLSLLTATAATVLALLLGVPLAWLLARPGGRFRPMLRAVITVPLVLPPVVGGVALFTVLGRSGLLGRPLYELTGFALPFTPYAVVLAQLFVALPYLVLSVEGALRATDRRFEDAAQTLGARPLTVFRRVTLPLVGPGIAAGAVLAWARALGEFGATITFAGNFPGTTQTMPLAVYLALETDPDAAILLSVLLLAVSVAVLALLRDRWVRRW